MYCEEMNGSISIIKRVTYESLQVIQFRVIQWMQKLEESDQNSDVNYFGAQLNMHGSKATVC